MLIFLISYPKLLLIMLKMIISVETFAAFFTNDKLYANIFIASIMIQFISSFFLYF